MKIPFLIRGVLAISLFLTLPFPARVNAEIREATLFPNSAKIVDVTRLALQPAGKGTLKAVLNLPPQALPESVTVGLEPGSALRIVDQTWKQISRQDDGRLAEIRRQLLQAKTERIGIVAGMHALETQILFWQTQAKARPTGKTPEETVNLSALIARNIKKAFQEKLSLEPDLEKADKKIKELQEELNRIAGQKESLWEVTLLLEGPQAREATLRVTYSLTGCGWLPLYRLDARPRDSLILFTWDAEVWQSSGMDWNQVETRLATLQPRTAITPPEIPPWIIRPRLPEPRPKGRARAEMMEMSEAKAMLVPELLDAAPPQETRQGTFAVWSLGKKTIPAGSRQRIGIREESWGADFLHLLRPGMTPQAFVQASVKLPEGREIPPGAATFLIDGASLGKRSFAFAGREGTLFFGVDPLVTAEVLLLSRKGGEKGFITDRQTQEWAWQTDIANTGASPVRIRLEEPRPQPRDERIKLTFKQDPQPSEQTPELMIWRLDLPAGQKKSLLGTIILEAPKEIDLDLGWRR